MLMRDFIRRRDDAMVLVVRRSAGRRHEHEPAHPAVASASDKDVVLVRQRARQVSACWGFRQAGPGAHRHRRVGSGARAPARSARARGRPSCWPTCTTASSSSTGQRDRAPAAVTARGRCRRGLVTAHRLMDECLAIGRRRRRRSIRMRKVLPPQLPVSPTRLAQIAAELAATPAANSYLEVQQQNRELVETLAELRERQEDLLSLTRELEDTNRGIVALYAEIEDKAEHLRRADEMKSRFLSNTSHELRTPLSSIRALSKLLLDRMDGELTFEQERQVA
jgi:signal transduction histidine kinase